MKQRNKTHRAFTMLALAGLICFTQPAFSLTWAFDRYTGTGSNNFPILGSSGMNFQPDLVIIKGTGATPAYICTSTLTAGNSKAMDVSGAYSTDAITGLLPTGFNLGTNAAVNAAGSTYDFVAFQSGADMVVGSYAGTGGTHTLSGLGFTPCFVIVFSDGGPAPPLWTNTQMVGTGSAMFGTAQIWFWYITALNAGSFTVNSFLNNAGTAYHYVAFNAASAAISCNSYAGSGGNQSLATGFAPQYVVACNASVSGPSVQRTATNAANESVPYTASSAKTTEITAFNANSFTVKAGSANANSTFNTNYFVAFGNGTASPLPIKLLHFSSACAEAKTQLNWVTATETNNAFFSIERTKDGNTYEVIAKVPGAGNASYTHTYSILDTNAGEELWYYRLRQTDYDGKNTCSDIIAGVHCSPTGSPFALSVKTVADQHKLHLIFSLESDSHLQYQTVDMNGKLLESGQMEGIKGLNSSLLDLNSYPAGMYLFRLSNGHQEQAKVFYSNQ
jgi:hypothetical protein